MIFRLTVDCDLFLYGDDTCLLYQDKDLEQNKELTENFSNICDWVVDNKLCIHIGEDRSNLFSTKAERKKSRTLDINYGDIKIKQYSKITY